MFEHGKMVRGEGLPVLEERMKTMDPDENEIYKFLGIEQADGIKTKHVFERVKNEVLECDMGWFPSLICKNYIFKDFVKTIEATSLKCCMILKLRTLHPKKITAQVKFANCSNAHAQTFVLLNGEMAIVSACFRKLKFWLWLLWTVFFLMQTGFLKIGLNKLS